MCIRDRPFTSKVPVTVRLSSTWVSPVAESSIRLFPEVVLISESESTPIVTESAVISVEVIAWLNWTVPVTLWLSPEALPIVVFPSTVKVPSTLALPSTLRLRSTSKSSVTFTVPPAESKTRFPEVVEISVSPSTPIWILSAVISVSYTHLTLPTKA